MGCHFLLRVSSQPRAQTLYFCIAGGFFIAEPPGKPIHRKIHEKIQLIFLIKGLRKLWTKDSLLASTPKEKNKTKQNCISHHNWRWKTECFTPKIETKARIYILPTFLKCCIDSRPCSWSRIRNTMHRLEKMKDKFICRGSNCT